MKTPFTYDDLWGIIYDANRAEVAACHSNKQDAAFIVRACNAHDDLVAALEAYDMFFDKLPKGQLGKIVCDIGLLNDAFCKSRAALAKAQGN